MWSKYTNKAEVAFQNALAEFFIALNETEGYDLDKCVETISQFAERGARDLKAEIEMRGDDDE